MALSFSPGTILLSCCGKDSVLPVPRLEFQQDQGTDLEEYCKYLVLMGSSQSRSGGGGDYDSTTSNDGDGGSGGSSGGDGGGGGGDGGG